MNKHLNGPFVVEYVPFSWRTFLPSHYNVLDADGLCVAVFAAYENLSANHTCERYNLNYHNERVREWNKLADENEHE